MKGQTKTEHHTYRSKRIMDTQGETSFVERLEFPERSIS